MTNTVQNPGGRLTLSINTTDITVTDDGGVIAHRPCSVFPCQKNRAGDDSSDYVADAVELAPGDAGVSFRPTVAGDHEERIRVFGVEGRSKNAEAMAVVCVPWRKQAIPVFRPPAIGRASNPIVAYFRNNPIYHGQVRWDRLQVRYPLPSTVDVDAITARFSRFSGDIWSSWKTDDKTPDLQHPGYGTYYQADVSIALTILCSDIPVERKKPLAIAMIQRGIDYVGAFADGRENWMVDGGHMWGRWALMMFAGHMLNVPQIVYPSQTVQARLVERRAFYIAQPAWWSGCPYGWRRGWNELDFLYKHPSQWTDTARGERFAICGYLPHVLGAQVGSVMAFRMMGLSYAYGDALSGLVDEWMQPIKQGVRDALNDNGCSSVVESWGSDYSISGNTGVCADLWVNHDPHPPMV